MAATSLEQLLDIAEISPFVTRILGQNPGPFTLQGTNTYLVGAPHSKSVILIDTGEGEEGYPALLTKALGACTISDIILTHWHHDHVEGLPSVLSLCPSPPRIHKIPSPDHPIENALALHDGQEFNLASPDGTEDATLTIVTTPGHTTDSISLHLATLAGHEALFTADTVLGHGTAVFERLAPYMTSLSRLRDLLTTVGAPSLTPIYPGHGAVVKDGKRKLDEYIAHRAQREEEVVEGVSRATERGERVTAESLVGDIYGPQLPEAVRPAAARGLQLILDKLEGESKVRGGGEKGYELSSGTSESKM